MKLYLYSENCVQGGKVASVDPEPDEISGDWFLWGNGTEAELVLQAKDRLGKRYDTRAGGAGDAFAHKCSRYVLEYLI
jgi:hypothetical protein